MGAMRNQPLALLLWSRCSTPIFISNASASYYSVCTIAGVNGSPGVGTTMMAATVVGDKNRSWERAAGAELDYFDVPE